MAWHFPTNAREKTGGGGGWLQAGKLQLQPDLFLDAVARWAWREGRVAAGKLQLCWPGLLTLLFIALL